jgi:hypothetical protein
MKWNFSGHARTSAAAVAVAGMNGTSPSNVTGGAQSNNPDDIDDTSNESSSDGEDPEITGYGVFLPF